MAPLQFHFDYLSPYGWIASKAIEPMAQRHGRAVDWRPVLLGVSVLKVMGLKPLLDTPLKSDYVRRDVARTARRLGLSLGRALSRPPASSLVPARATCWIRHTAPERTAAVVHAMYDAIWRDGIDLAEPSDLLKFALPPGLDVHALVDATGSPAAADLLRAEVAASLNQGVFGSPMLVVDGEPFWGADRLAEAEHWLTTGGW